MPPRHLAEGDRNGFWISYPWRSKTRQAATGKQADSAKPAGSAKQERRETPEERIRRRFVEGRIDLDRYEEELWEELRPK